MRTLLAFCCAIPALVSPGSAQTVQLLPSDLASYDQFGTSISVDSGCVLASSRFDDDGGSGSGSAYLFELPTGPYPGIQNELVKFTASNGQANDNFGNSVSLNDGLALIGAINSNVLANNAGGAYLFDANPSSSTLGAELMWFGPAGADPSDTIGWSVNLDSGLALVGAARDDDRALDAGAAYLFDADPSSPTFGQMLLKLTASDGGTSHLFGSSVSMADGLALVGAMSASTAGGSTGAAYLFDVNPASPNFGLELTKFAPSNGAPGDRFGQSVSMSDGRALVGAPYHNAAWFRKSRYDGAAYLFDADPASVMFSTLLTEFQPPNTHPHAMELGRCVSLDGQFAALASPREDFEVPGFNIWKSGTAYVFDADPISPEFSNVHTKIHNPDPGYFEYFGRSVSIQNGVVAAGAPYETTFNSTWKKDAGSVFVTRLVDLR
jgi:hypothetical protein